MNVVAGGRLGRRACGRGSANVLGDSCRYARPQYQPIDLVGNLLKVGVRRGEVPTEGVRVNRDFASIKPLRPHENRNSRGVRGYLMEEVAIERRLPNGGDMVVGSGYVVVVTDEVGRIGQMHPCVR